MRTYAAKVLRLLSKKERQQAFVLVGLMIIGAALEVVGVGAIPAFVSFLSDPERMLDRPLFSRLASSFPISSTNDFLLWASGALLLFFLLKNAYLAALTYINARFLFGLQTSLATRLFKKYLHRPYTFHLQTNTAELLRAVNGDTWMVVHGVVIHALVLIMEFCVLVLVFALLIYVEPLVSLVTVASLGTASAVFYRASRNAVSHYGKEDQYQRGQMIKFAQEGLGGLKEIQVLGRESFFDARYTESTAAHARAARFAKVAADMPRPFIETIAILGLFMIAAIFLVQGRPLQSIIPTLALFSVAAVRLIPSFNRLTSSVTQLRYNTYSVDVVYGELVTNRSITPPCDTETSGQSALVTLKSAIELDDVHYVYPGADTPAVRGISLQIPVGSAVAFVGPSGGGKTTVVDLILGLMSPTNGEIRVDGTNIHANLGGWRRNVGYIPQSIYLSDDTIRRNIAFGLQDSEIDEDKVWLAVTSAQLDELVQALPDGLNTPVGEHGVRLSGGQRQRIGIARALYHNPEVLIMDEATSALDNETERLIVHAVERLRGDRTIIMVAHRLSTVKGCDRLFFLKGGSVTACGEYDELLQASSDFRLMAV
jgi:ATP-binding cassette subfamily C protein